MLYMIPNLALGHISLGMELHDEGAWCDDA